MSRRLASTPSGERSQAQAGLGEAEGEPPKEIEQGQSSPAAASPPTGNMGPNQGLAQQVAAEGGLSGSAVFAVDATPVKCEAEEPELSSPNAESAPSPLPAKEESDDPTISGARIIPGPVAQILAQLAQLKGKG